MNRKNYNTKKPQPNKGFSLSVVCNGFYSFLFVLLFLFSPLLCFATSVEDGPQLPAQSSIYVVGNTQIYGAENISVVEVVATKTYDNSFTKRNEKAKHESSSQSISAQIEIKKTKDLAKSKELEKQTKENIKVNFINSTTNSNFAGNTSAITKGAVLNSNFYSQNKLSKTISQDIAISYTCKSCKKKQKFYTSLSYLQFGKYRNSSLRAPPVVG